MRKAVTTLTVNGAEAVVPWVRSQSRSDFDELYAAGYQRLTLQLYAYLGDLAEAQDVVQEAFCRALSAWRKVSRYDDPVAWVRRVAWNLATSGHHRRTTVSTLRRREREQLMVEPSPDRAALVRALLTIPSEQRRAVVLHYLARLSVAEIADQVGVAERTVQSWVSQGRAALAGRLADASSNVQKGN